MTHLDPWRCFRINSTPPVPQRVLDKMPTVDGEPRILVDTTPPDVLGLGDRFWPDEWVIAGPRGALMHDDRHMPRYSVLLVCHGDDCWELAMVRKREKDGVQRFHAGRGIVAMVDVHQPHSLDHHHIPERGGWVAIAWNRKTRNAAERVMVELRALAQRCGWLSKQREVSG